jgi:hypothetical protein
MPSASAARTTESYVSAASSSSVKSPSWNCWFPAPTVPRHFGGDDEGESAVEEGIRMNELAVNAADDHTAL